MYSSFTLNTIVFYYIRVLALMANMCLFFQLRLFKKSILKQENIIYLSSGKKVKVAQFSSVAQSCPTLCDPMIPSMPGLPVHHQLPELPKFMSIELVMPSSRLILCCPLLLLPSIPSRIRLFSNESTFHEVAKVLEWVPLPSPS